jgi:hypothetical protein
MKKTLLAFAVMAAATLGFADEAKVSFNNKVSSDIVGITIPKEGDTTAEFAGIKDTVKAEFTSEKVDAAVKLTFTFNTATNSDDSVYAGLFGYTINDYYIEFRPVDMFTIGWHDTISTDGSYLPIEDDNLSNGNLGSDFVGVIRPIEGLRIAAGLDFDSLFGKKDDDSNKGPKINIGADYVADGFSLGVTLRNPINNIGYGAFASLSAVENLWADIGFSYNDSFKDVSGNLLSLGATYDVGICSLAFDFVTNFGKEESAEDLYVGLSAGFGVTDALTLGAMTQAEFDFNTSDSQDVLVEASAEYVVGKNTFSAAVDVEFTATATAVSFPVYWKYKL